MLDRFQRVVRDNSIRNEDKFELSEKQRKSRENEQERNEKAPSKNINVAIKEEKENTNAGSTGEGKNSNLKTRRFATKNNKNVKDIACESENVEEKENDNGQILSKYRPDTKIRRTACDYMSQSIKDLEKRDKANAEKSGYLKRRETHGNNGIGMMTNFESSNDKSNDDQMRFVRKARKKQRHVIKDNSLQNQTLWERRLQNQYENNIERRGAKWHTNVKKDISRLLHSFGFAVENDDKDKIKELKKKLKGN